MTERPRVVIVGAGFAGLYCARALRRAPVQVTVVDRRNHHLFQPLLYQVATGELSPADIAAPTRTILRRQQNAQVLLAEVRGVDLEARSVRLDDGALLSYDHLVLAMGANHTYFGHPEVVTGARSPWQNPYAEWLIAAGELIMRGERPHPWPAAPASRRCPSSAAAPRFASHSLRPTFVNTASRFA